MAYPDLDELVAASAVPELINLDPEQQLVLYESAINEIEKYCEQSFTLQTAVTKHLDGHGGRQIGLPQRLVTLSELTVHRSGLTASEVTVTETGDMLVVSETAGVSTYYERTLREMMATTGMEFTFGPRTVAVTGDWGWTDSPTEVNMAILLDMEDNALADANSLSSTVRAFRGLGINDVSQGNLRADFALIGPTLSVRVLRLLSPYVWTGPVGAMV